MTVVNKRPAEWKVGESSSAASSLKKSKLSHSASLGKNLSSRDFSKLKKAGKTGNVNLRQIKTSNPIVTKLETAQNGTDSDSKVRYHYSHKFGEEKASASSSSLSETVDKTSWKKSSNFDKNSWKNSSTVQKSGREALEKLTKKQKKKLREKKRPHYEDVVDIKKVWEELRAENSKEKQAKLSEKILNKLSDEKLLQLCHSHDTCRVICWAYRFAKPDLKAKVFSVLYPSFESLAKARYGKHVALALIRHNSKSQNGKLISSLQNKVKEMFVHCFANEVVEELYNCHANQNERTAMQHEVYSRYFVMKAAEEEKEREEKEMGQGGKRGEREGEDRTMQIKSLQMLLEKSPNLRSPVLTSVKAFVLKCISTSAVRHSFAHKIILEYFTVLHRDTQQGGRGVIGAEMVPLLRDWLIQMAHTPNGAKVVLYALWYSDTKDRKAILKMFKEKIIETSQHETAYLIICAILDCVDDTKLINTTVLQPLIKDFDKVVKNNFGLRCIIHAIYPRYGLLFNVEVTNLLALGDDNENSKKSKDVRYKECAQTVQTKVQEYLINALDGNAAAFEEKANFHLVSAFLKSSFVDAIVKTKLLQKLASLYAEDDSFPQAFLSFSIMKGLLAEEHLCRNEFAVILASQLKELPDQKLLQWCKDESFSKKHTILVKLMPLNEKLNLRITKLTSVKSEKKRGKNSK